MMMMARHQIYGRVEKVVHRRIADQDILIPVAQRLGDLQNIFAVNEVAAYIFTRCGSIESAAGCSLPDFSGEEVKAGC
jgi:hypothetical protein